MVRIHSAVKRNAQGELGRILVVVNHSKIFRLCQLLQSDGRCFLFGRDPFRNGIANITGPISEFNRVASGSVFIGRTIKRPIISDRRTHRFF